MSLRNTALAVSFITAVACGESLASSSAPVVEPAPVAVDEPASDPAVEPAPAAPKATPNPAGGVSGTVKFTGSAPAPERVEMDSDPNCVGMHPDGLKRSTVKVNAGGGLADVFVQLTGVPDERYKAPDEPVTLDQRGCTYEPHVFGIIKKQDIEIINSDATLHNIHAVPKSNKEFNVGMPNQGMRITKTFKKDEEAILIKCDVHTWMKSYCFSMEHPYFAVTNAEGKFRIDTSDLPDGEYGVKMWHESLGESTGKVTVKDGAATFDHSIKG